MTMNKLYRKTAAAFCLAALLVWACSGSVLAAPAKIIFDTDMAEDVDDVGALALLHALADAGEAEILGCMISVPHEYVGPCIDVINTFYGRPDIPIGHVRGFQRGYPTDNGQQIPSNYAQKMAETFPHSLKKSSDAEDAVALYRKILASQPDQSVQIVSVGFLTNLKNLLNSTADAVSPLNGEDLVAKKVSQWVCMGAIFPNRGREYNVMMDTGASVRAINDWPTPIIFSGFEIGARIFTANTLKSKPETNPIRMGYEWYWGKKENINRESWDLTTVLYAVRGAEPYWTLSEPGKCLMHATHGYGENEWIPYAKGNHRYLIEKMPPAEVGKVIDELICREPRHNYTAANGFIELFDGKTMEGWKSNSDSWKLQNGTLCSDGKPGNLFYSGNVNEGTFENYILHIEAKALPGAMGGILLNTRYAESGETTHGYKVQINNSQAKSGAEYEHRKTGSLYNVRNVYKQLVGDNEWFNLDITVRENHVAIEVNGLKVVDYREPKSAALFEPGTFALQSLGADNRVHYRRVAVKPLPNEVETIWAPEPDAKQKAFDKLSASDFPLVDLHTHLKGGFTSPMLLDYTYSSGVNFGVGANCGLKFPITNDFGALEFLKQYEGSPFFLAIQAEGREWVNMFSKETRLQFDYVFTDSMTLFNREGKRMRLWIPEETEVGEPQEFMDMLVERIESIMTEPIDIYANPTFLPPALAKDYETLWTDARMDRVVAAAKKNNVAIEINSNLKLPSLRFIKMAKAAGLKFTLGTNNASPDLGDHLGYALEVIEKCGLSAEDMWMPGKFPAPRK
ncbi:MAG: DUF1080 domain-containing protein [Verrucomicrobiae bacterium]|nr:DUF1080 domain-containing protein [Verrucomicrobiae bacterium]